MDPAHIHLMTNHVPVLGTIFALLVLVYGLARRSQEVIRTGLWTLVIVGAASGVVYLTGEPAEELVEGLSGFSHPVLERHEAAALWATAGAALVGVVSLAGLVFYRAKQISRRYAAGVLLLTLGLTGLMGWTANLGGQVMHAEIRSDDAASTDAGVDSVVTVEFSHPMDPSVAEYADDREGDFTGTEVAGSWGPRSTDKRRRMSRRQGW